MRLDRPGVPLFLQFKLCDQMTRRNCREAREAGFNVPCYRMHLRSARSSRQHEMLLDLEATGQEVYYCAPMFQKPEELNDAFLQRSVRARSIWIRPTDIGPLPDDGDHHVSFEPGSPWTRFSKPRPIEAKREFEVVAKQLMNRLDERGRTDLSKEHLEGLADGIASIADKRRDISQRQLDLSKEAARPAAPLQRVAYYASIFLESQLFCRARTTDRLTFEPSGQGMFRAHQGATLWRCLIQGVDVSPATSLSVLLVSVAPQVGEERLRRSSEASRTPKARSAQPPQPG